MTKGRQCTLVVAIGDNSRFCGIHASMERKAAANNLVSTVHVATAPEQAPIAVAHPVSVIKKERKPKAMAFLELEDDDEAYGDEEDSGSISGHLWSSTLDNPIDMLRKLHRPLAFGGLMSFKPQVRPVELGSPFFSLSSFLDQRSSLLLQNIRVQRMKMVHLQLSHDLYVMEEATERAKNESLIENEASCLEMDRQRKMKTLEKLYRRKHEEDQQKKRRDGGTGGDEFGHAPTAHHRGAMDMDLESAASSPRGRQRSDTTPSSRGASAGGRSGGLHGASPIGAGTDSTSGGGGRGKIEKIGKCDAKECGESSLPLSAFCWAHVLQDPLQKLFVSCSFNPTTTTTLPEALNDSGLAMVPCSYPVIRGGPSPPLCTFHSSLIHAEDGEDGDAEEDEE